MKSALLVFAIWVYFIIAWVVNLVQFINQDFEAPYKGEVIRAVGVFIPPTASITVWF